MQTSPYTAGHWCMRPHIVPLHKPYAGLPLHVPSGPIFVNVSARYHPLAPLMSSLTSVYAITFPFTIQMTDDEEISTHCFIVQMCSYLASHRTGKGRSILSFSEWILCNMFGRISVSLHMCLTGGTSFTFGLTQDSSRQC